jgi:hypothetical protein
MVGLFVERAVAFIDILGFKKLVDEAEASEPGFQRLAGLRAVVDGHVLFDNSGLAQTVPNELKPKYIFISDSIILSAPLRHRHTNITDGLGIVVIKTIQIAQRIIELGHLVRGGISVGNVWHDERNIFGAGYVSAYHTEQVADHPRVLLSPAAAKVWQTSSRAEANLCIPDGRDLIVDILCPYYLRETSVGLPYEGYFQAFRAHINSNLQTMPLGSAERSKWEWIVGFFNGALVRHGINVKPFSSLPIP